MRLGLLLVTLASLAWSRRLAPDAVTQWTCIPLDSAQLAPGVAWEKFNCSATTSAWRVEPLAFNIVTVDLTSNATLVPLAADPLKQVDTIPNMAQSSPLKPLVGINGGYFWRVDSQSFFDDVCFGKTRQDALQNVSSEHPNYGVGDCTLVVNGTSLAHNCDCPGQNRPTVLIIDGVKSRFEVLHKGQQVSKDVRNAIGAGPNLVSTVNGSAIEAIPSDDYNVNLLSRAANTAVGLIADAGGVLMSKAVLVTVDGNDHCGFKSNCGVSDHELAYFMKDQLHCASAMGMDQGGSTTMYVQGKGIGGVVNCSDMPNCDGRVRRVYDGLFVAEV